MKRKLFLIGAGLLAQYLWSRYERNNRIKTRELMSVPDEHGNYDMDGVSYDPEVGQVVVGSDGFTERAPKPHQHH